MWWGQRLHCGQDISQKALSDIDLILSDLVPVLLWLFLTLAQDKFFAQVGRQIVN